MTSSEKSILSDTLEKSVEKKNERTLFMFQKKYSLKKKKKNLSRRRFGAVRRSTKGGWTEKEDKSLQFAVKKYNAKNWKRIAALVPSRTHIQCLHRWQKVLNPKLVKGPWTPEEDELLHRYSEIHKNNWPAIASQISGRNSKQCRERWFNHLSPDIKKGAWEENEEKILVETQKQIGNKWSEIRKKIPGRSQNSCKNQFHKIQNRKKKNVKAKTRSKTRVKEKKKNTNSFTSTIPGTIISTNSKNRISEIKKKISHENSDTSDDINVPNAINQNYLYQTSISHPHNINIQTDNIHQVTVNENQQNLMMFPNGSILTPFMLYNQMISNGMFSHILKNGNNNSNSYMNYFTNNVVGNDLVNDKDDDTINVDHDMDINLTMNDNNSHWTNQEDLCNEIELNDDDPTDDVGLEKKNDDDDVNVLLEERDFNYE